MPAQLTYPGVYIEEIPSGVRTIMGVSTSITAFLGRAPCGPVNDPFIINSFGDFERTFGGLQVDYPMSYAVRDFYLNGGSKALIVRLFRESSKDAIDKVASAVGAIPDTENDLTKVAAAARDGFTEEPAKTVANIIALKAEEAAKASGATTKSLKDAVKSLVDDPNSIISSVESINYAIQAVANAAEASPETDPIKVAKAASDKAATFVNEPEMTFAINFAAKIVDAGKIPQTTTDKVKEVSQKEAAAAVVSLDSTAMLSIDKLNLEASSPGKWGNTLSAKVDFDGIDANAAELANRLNQTASWVNRYLFNLTVVENPPDGQKERMLNVSLHPNAGPRRIDRVLEQESNLVKFKAPLPDEQNADRPSSTQLRMFSAGRDSMALDPPTYVGSEEDKTGLHALDNADLFNLLCIPPDSREAGFEDTDNGVYSPAMEYCYNHRAMLIVDSPLSWGESEATAANNATKGLPNLGLSGKQSQNAALFFPRVLEADPLRPNQIDTFVPCGIIAGIMARIDADRGVWKAPAGLDASLTGIVGLQVNLNDNENGMLNPLGINCLRDFKSSGRVVWGARTLRGADQLADEWKYIPVRRTALFIEESLFRGLKWVVFEPNDEPLWAQIRLNVGSFMHDLFRQGAFQGTQPQEAYFVKCDKETTTQSDINKGIVNIVVGFAPLKPAEFVVIKLQQMAGQIQT